MLLRHTKFHGTPVVVCTRRTKDSRVPFFSTALHTGTLLSERFWTFGFEYTSQRQSSVVNCGDLDETTTSYHYNRNFGQGTRVMTVQPL